MKCFITNGKNAPWDSSSRFKYPYAELANNTHGFSSLFTPFFFSRASPSRPLIYDGIVPSIYRPQNRELPPRPRVGAMANGKLIMRWHSSCLGDISIPPWTPSWMAFRENIILRSYPAGIRGSNTRHTAVASLISSARDRSVLPKSLFDPKENCNIYDRAIIRAK